MDVPPLPLGEVPNLGISELRIAVAPMLGGFPVAADIRDAIAALALRLEQSGAIVEQSAGPSLNLKRVERGRAHWHGNERDATKSEEPRNARRLLWKRYSGVTRR
jgi:Asp-tRNA(Asn)/Glu-tRNA(Gln) amidotransferase A subunit family amidase